MRLATEPMRIVMFATLVGVLRMRGNPPSKQSWLRFALSCFRPCSILWLVRGEGRVDVYCMFLQLLVVTVVAGVGTVQSTKRTYVLPAMQQTQ